jgi:5-(carboxyamino)imidazole ribonucleotide synthase
MSVPTLPILPPATIGILGGGQLGRMTGAAARELGYGVVVLDPDPDCPARAIADGVEVGGYDDVAAALRLAARSAVVTLELEHVSPEVVAALDALTAAGGPPLRPGAAAVRATQDRLAERRFLASIGAPVAEWRAVRTREELGAAVAELAGARPSAFRLKAALGGYDGRSQVRLGPVAGDGDLDGPALDAAYAALERSAAAHGLLLEREVDFALELSVVLARGLDGGVRAYPPARNRHDDGILVESVAPAPVGEVVTAAALALAERIAVGLGSIGVTTAELFLLRDGSLAVNELAPRVHNSGHWTQDGAATSQFEQHVRAICGLPLGASDVLVPTAMANLLGAGPRRPAGLAGVAEALAEPRVHLHLYGKREVFERRKMGHVNATGATADEALARANEALAGLRWEGIDG